MRKEKILILTLLLFLISFAGQNFVSAQSYSVPSRLMLAGDENEEQEAERADLLREHFYPIGWSKDGKFAYYVEPPDEACGCYFSDLVIQDLRTDKILWRRGYSGEMEKPETIETYWKKNQKEFSLRLAQYGIVAKRFDLQTAPFEYQNDALDFDLTQNIEIEDIFAVGNVALRLVSKTKGAKMIYEEKYAPKDYSGFRSAEIGGVLTSPFEPRAAVVLIETYRGWEGPPNVTRISIIGASLTQGFR